MTRWIVSMHHAMDLDTEQFLHLKRILAEALGVAPDMVTVVKGLEAIHQAAPPPTAADPRLIKRTRLSRFGQ